MLQLILSFIIAFGVTFIIVPAIIAFSKKREFFDQPGKRKIHTQSLPSLGGLAVICGFILPILLWIPLYNFSDYSFIYGAVALLLLLVMGVRDDLVPLRPITKFVGQIVTAFIVVHLGETKLVSLYGLFGIEELPVWAGYGLSILVIIFIVNAFNLIDGVDGLASTIGVIASVAFGIWFFLNGNILMYIISFSMAGALLAFLKYNFTPSRIFLGDSGSMLIGFVSAVLALRFIQYNATLPIEDPNKMTAAPILAICVMIIPIYDTLRLFLLRSLFKRSPFNSDKNHLHHLLIRLGMSHPKITIILSSMSIVFIIIGYFGQKLGNLYLSAILFVVLIALTLLIDYLLTIKYPSRIKQKKVFRQVAR